jgi:hypothetical protein
MTLSLLQYNGSNAVTVVAGFENSRVNFDFGTMLREALLNL